jgi:hypothetical protein
MGFYCNDSYTRCFNGDRIAIQFYLAQINWRKSLPEKKTEK